MTPDPDILTSLEAILGELSADPLVSAGAADLPAALGGIEVVLDGGGSAAVASGEVVATSLARPALDIADLIGDFELESGEFHPLELTALLDTLSASKSELGAVRSGSATEHVVNEATSTDLWSAPGVTVIGTSITSILYDDVGNHSTNTL